MFEIEIKAKITDSQYDYVLKYLDKSFSYQGSVFEKDTYFNGIDRDFAKTDEAFRIRKEIKDDKPQYLVTYKGAKLSKNIKVRKELETAVEDYDTFYEIITALGFKEVATVEKQRLYYKNDKYTATLDTVEGLGKFLELEIVADESEDYGIYTEKLFSLLNELGVDNSAATNTSYLEMLQK